MPFKPGQSGNPGGRPAAEREVLELARSHGVAAMTKLVGWMDSQDPKTSLMACNAVLDRGFGKPTQPLASDAESPLVQTITPERLAELAAQALSAIR